MRKSLRKLSSLLAFSLLALLLIGFAGVVWGTLIYANMRVAHEVPWCLPALCAFLYLIWRYLEGHGWPRSTSVRRRVLLRANPVPLAAYGWSAVAGVLAVLSLAGFWIVMFRIIPMHANPLLPGRFNSSSLFMAAVLAGASLLAPIVEESAVRGYLQNVLERDFSAVTAVVLSSVVFSLAHVTQGLVWPKLVFYFLVGIAFGALALLNDSILPVIPVHIAGDLIFFLFVWPHDQTRTLIWQSGSDLWFWVHVVQTVGFTVVSFIAFRLIRPARTSRGAFGEASPASSGLDRCESVLNEYVHRSRPNVPKDGHGQPAEFVPSPNGLTRDTASPHLDLR
jgi:membrane protease YdiL (CAAX protease family)